MWFFHPNQVSLWKASFDDLARRESILNYKEENESREVEIKQENKEYPFTLIFC